MSGFRQPLRYSELFGARYYSASLRDVKDGGKGWKGGRSKDVDAVVAEASHGTPNRPEAASGEVADDQADEEREKLAMGSATAELQNQRLRQPTDAKGEPEVVHGVTDG